MTTTISRKGLPHLCKHCATEDPSQFYNHNKSTCKRCICASVKKHLAEGKTCERLCKDCGCTDPSQFYNATRNRCKTCVGQRMKKRHAEDPLAYERYKTDQLAWRRVNKLRYRWNCAKQRAKQSGVAFDITVGDLQEIFDSQNGKCYYSGVEMSLNPHDNDLSVSLDRVDSAGGYTKGNIVMCTTQCNLCKQNLPVGKWYELMRRILDHQNFG